MWVIPNDYSSLFLTNKNIRLSKIFHHREHKRTATQQFLDENRNADLSKMKSSPG